MTRWLVTGAGGMLGRDLVAALAGADVTAMTRADLDITDVTAVKAAVGGCDVVINAAGWTDVDGAETQEAAAHAVNGTGPAHLAAACAAAGSRLVHVSTDYVFDGRADSPYAETAPPAPANAYGRTKLAGERAVLAAGGFVVRTAWLYGEHGTAFPHTLLRLARDRDTIDVVDDQVGAPTWSGSLAGQLVALGRSPAAPGIYHGSAGGATTWYGFGRALFAELGGDPGRIRPTTSARFPRPAVRPAYSVLGQARWADTGVEPLEDWRPMLHRAVAAGVFAAGLAALPGGAATRR